MGTWRSKKISDAKKVLVTRGGRRAEIYRSEELP